jgi:hypothetical protein
MGKKSLSVKDMNSQKITNLGAGTADTTDAATTAQVKAAQDFAASLNNATGTLSPVTTFIPTFDTQVRTNRLDQMTAPTAAVAFGSQQITGLADGTLSTHAATKGQMDAAIAALSSGLVFKGAVRAATTSNVNIVSAPATIDGVTPTSGDVFLLTGQTTGTQNGPYVWTAAAAVMNRATNWDTTGEATPGSLWVVQQGTFDNQLAIMSNDTFTLGSSTATFVFLNPASAADNDTGYTTTCPSVSAGNTWTVNHALGSKAVIVQVYRTASPFDEVEVSIERSDTANVLIKPDVALSSGEYTVVVSKVV